MTDLLSTDFYMIAITALLPLTAVLLVLQVNPYQALVIRGILGAIAALVYALLGAADVALTEALVGTMLSITLYAVAVRSSMTMRIGVIEGAIAESDTAKGDTAKEDTLKRDKAKAELGPLNQLVSALEQTLNDHHVRVELLTYADTAALTTALADKEIHAIYSNYPYQSSRLLKSEFSGSLQVRVQRLYNIFEASPPPDTKLIYTDLAKPGQLEQSNLVGESR